MDDKIRKAVVQSKVHKADRLDEVFAEFIKVFGNYGNRIVTKLFNKIYH